MQFVRASDGTRIPHHTHEDGGVMAEVKDGDDLFVEGFLDKKANENVPDQQWNAVETSSFAVNSFSSSPLSPFTCAVSTSRCISGCRLALSGVTSRRSNPAGFWACKSNQMGASLLLPYTYKKHMGVSLLIPHI